MALTIPQMTAVVRADNQPTPNTISLRDNNGNIQHAGVTATSLTVNGIVNYQTNAKSTSYSLGTAETAVLANATSGALTMTLPAVAGLNGRVYVVMKTDSSANTVTINVPDAATINGATTKVLTTQYQFARVITDGTNWFLI